MTPTAPPPNRPEWALFLDIDGTLLEIAELPQAVCVPESLRALLSAETRRRNGALALVSGRSLASIDRLFAPMQLVAAGQHGLERRDIEGRVSRVGAPSALLHKACTELHAVVAQHPGLLLEDKGMALALHYRQAPALAEIAHIAMQSAAAELPGFHVQPGKCVWELKPRAVSKGTAIRTFLTEAPFADRLPVFIGDDLTDEDGFDVVNDAGGISIRVGVERATAAQFALASVTAVRQWLVGS